MEEGGGGSGRRGGGGSGGGIYGVCPVPIQIWALEFQFLPTHELTSEGAWLTHHSK